MAALFGKYAVDQRNTPTADVYADAVLGFVYSVWQYHRSSVWQCKQKLPCPVFSNNGALKGPILEVPACAHHNPFGARLASRANNNSPLSLCSRCRGDRSGTRGGSPDPGRAGRPPLSRCLHCRRCRLETLWDSLNTWRTHGTFTGQRHSIHDSRFLPCPRNLVCCIRRLPRYRSGRRLSRLSANWLRRSVWIGGVVRSRHGVVTWRTVNTAGTAARRQDLWCRTPRWLVRHPLRAVNECGGCARCYLTDQTVFPVVQAYQERSFNCCVYRAHILTHVVKRPLRIRMKVHFYIVKAAAGFGKPFSATPTCDADRMNLLGANTRFIPAHLSPDNEVVGRKRSIFAVRVFLIIWLQFYRDSLPVVLINNVRNSLGSA